MQTLSILINLFAYSDVGVTNNPQLRDFDYARRINDVPTSKTRSQQHIVNVNQSETVLSMQRQLTTGASWTVTNPDGVTARYTWSGIDPVLRVARTGNALVDNDTCSIVRLGTNSKVVRLTFSALPATGIQPGDEIFLGEGFGLNPINQGIYSVVAATGAAVDILAPDMVNDPSVIITEADDVYIYSPGPVRENDFLRVADAAFNYGNRGEFLVTRVTSKFIEVQNMNVVPEGPVTADIVVYDQLYRLTYIEADQKVNVYINGSSQPVQVEPIQDGEPGLVGIYMLRGPVFSVRLENMGLAPANCTTFFAT